MDERRTCKCLFVQTYVVCTGMRLPVHSKLPIVASIWAEWIPATLFDGTKSQCYAHRARTLHFTLHIFSEFDACLWMCYVNNIDWSFEDVAAPYVLIDNIRLVYVLGLSTGCMHILTVLCTTIFSDDFCS